MSQPLLQPLLTRLVDSFGSTRRRRQLNAREEGIVRLEKIGSAAAVAEVIQQQAEKAQEDGLTRDQVSLEVSLPFVCYC